MLPRGAEIYVCVPDRAGDDGVTLTLTADNAKRAVPRHGWLWDAPAIPVTECLERSETRP